MDMAVERHIVGLRHCAAKTRPVPNNFDVVDHWGVFDSPMELASHTSGGRYNWRRDKYVVGAALNRILKVPLNKDVLFFNSWLSFSTFISSLVVVESKPRGDANGR